jgi:medium-chain acyl-[acyl-carrier-protein] hydrolase
MTPSRPRWLRCPRPNPRARARAICCHHAGGTASTFRHWFELLPTHLELSALQMPGRQDRLEDPPVTAMADVLPPLLAELRVLADRPYVLFGHSLGALIAYELASALDREGAGPVHLFVSGRGAPHRPSLFPAISHLPAEAFRARAPELFEAMPPELWDNDEAMELLLPMLRGDLTIADRYRWLPRPPLTLPVTALGGDRDLRVPPEDLAAWADYTRGEFARRMFPGGHFYLETHAEQLARLIAATLGTAMRGIG